MKVFIGTSGWSYEDWKGRFYPKGYYSGYKHLPYFSKEFNTVETNSTFYNFMREKTLQQWFDKTGDDFVFSLKLNKFFTHTKRLNIDDRVKGLFDNFVTAIDILKEKAGPVLVQLPPSLKKDTGLLENWLTEMPKYNYAFEFRHSSWMDDEVYQILKNYDSAFVFSQSSKWDTGMIRTNDLIYVRLHGPQEFAKSKYSEDEMKKYSDRIKKIAEENDKVFIYFNNSHQAYAIENAKQMLNEFKNEL